MPWRFNQKCHAMRAGQMLRIECLVPAVVHWSTDGWQTVHDLATTDTRAGVHYADLSTAALGDGSAIDFTFYWPGAHRWEGADFSVAVVNTGS
jgi:glucoamylase